MCLRQQLNEEEGDSEEGKDACNGGGGSSRSPSFFRRNLFSVVVVLLAILIGLLCKSLTHNLDRPVAAEAVPIWQTSELHWAVRYFVGYLFGIFVPVGQLTKCPTVVDWANTQEADAAKSCITPIRAMVEQGDELVDLNELFDVQAIDIERSGDKDNSPVHVTLLKKKGTSGSDPTAMTNSNSKAPLILYMHGGGFTVRGGKKTLTAQIFGYLQQIGERDDDVNESANSFMDDAVWAIVDYRLAPEHLYPAATEDCLLALNHLVNDMNLGQGGIHISGISAGGTLAMEVTLKSLAMGIDSFYVDEPMVPLPSKDSKQRTWSFDSDSFRRYSYTRIPPVDWLEWSLKAMTGIETNHDVESSIPYGMITTDVDVTGGSIDAAEWKRSFDESNSTLLPRLFLVTANGDPLKDGGLHFKRTYEEVIEQVEAENPNMQPQIKYVESSSGHTSHYIFEQAIFEESMKEWYAEMKKAHLRKLHENGL
mmetsp:Transcript_18504/g.30292  ORF Transcript_18504/g.30292 Transcript_18504/m.30292 type:complete len:480 (+) Transcript_18504:87-1526(+)